MITSNCPVLDAIFIISPHGSLFSDAFTMNVCPEFTTDLKDFGDLTTKIKFKGEKVRKKDKKTLTPKEELLSADYQALQAFNYLKTWNIMETIKR